MDQKNKILRPENYKNHIDALRVLSEQDFLNLGLNYIAYIKPSHADNSCYSLHAADGSTISEFETVEEAVFATREESMKPVRLH